MSKQLGTPSKLTVERDGIYHALPTFASDVKGLTAMVFGASGISGHHMLRVLSKHPERWSAVYSVARKPLSYTNQLGENVKHVSADLLDDPSTTAEKLKAQGVRADYVFFFAYLQPSPPPGAPLWSNVEEMCNVNAKLLQNCLDALVLADIKPKRFLLQTGAKQYAYNCGAALAPSEESDPRVHVEPNFYYLQEDILFEYCKKHGVEWNVTRPCHILGAVPSAAMNFVYLLAVYASVQKHLGRKLDFPGDLAAWDKVYEQSSAMMNGYLAEWSVLTPHAGNEAFNAGDGGATTLARFWPALAGWYGLETSPPDEDAKYDEFTLPYKETPRGYGSPPTMRFTFKMVDWAQSPEVKQAWKEMSEKHSLVGDPFINGGESFMFADFALVGPYNIVYSYNKVRKFGWNGFVDSTESIRQVIEEFAEMKKVPKIGE